MYEIPQQLEYKEKIVFGLTFEQLIYVFISAFLILLIFKLNSSIQLRISLAIFPAVLAFGFIFFDFRTKLVNFAVWYKLRVLHIFELKNFMGVKIKDNFLVHKNKKLAVIKVDSLNFQIKPETEKETITLTFQKFLNSLDFPVQILMTTETLSLDSYLKSLKNRIEDKEIFKEYENHLIKVIKDNSVSNRNFYLVVPETSDLSIQVRLCEGRLNSLSLKTQRLGKNELFGLVKNIVNGNSHIFPERLTNMKDFLYANKKYFRTIYAHGYPRSVETGFLDRIVSSLGDFNLSMHIEPCPLETTMVNLNKVLQKQRADLYSAKLKNQLNSSLEIKYSDTLKTLENLQKGNGKLFNVSLYITCSANTKKDLDLLTKKVESELNSLLIIPRRPDFRMLQGLKSCMPINENLLKANRNITSTGLSAFFPFTSSFFKFDKTGIWFGLNKNNIPLIKDIFKLSNSNGICLASSGAGKSYMTKLFIARHLLNNTKVIVIDPQSEYKNLITKFNGQRIDLSKDSATIINPLDLMGHDYTEKRLSLMDLMPVMLGQLTEPQKSFIDQALTEAYEKKGIYMDDSQSWNNEPPILGDVLRVLEKMEKKAIALEKNTLRSLTNRLRLYVTGVFSFLNRHTNIDFKNNFVCFDIGNMPKQVKPTIMFLVLDYVYMKMKKDLNRKLLVIDEAWSLLSKTEEASYIFEIVKTCRKFNLGLFLINQEVEGMLNSEAGRSALANSSYTILLRQKPAVIDNVQKVFHLSNVERINLLTSGVGEGILLMEDEHSEIKIVASKEEHKIITTNADERLEFEVEENKGKKISIGIDELVRVHKSRGLKKEEREYLLKKGFREECFKSISSNKKEKYFVKPRFNETGNHLFVIEDIKNYLEKKKMKVELYVTKKPDIVFNLGKKKIAIEVETGAVLSKVSRMKDKLKVLNEYDEWFFVVTNKNKVASYRKYGKTIDVRFLRGKLDKILNSKKRHSA